MTNIAQSTRNCRITLEMRILGRELILLTGKYVLKWAEIENFVFLRKNITKGHGLGKSLAVYYNRVGSLVDIQNAISTSISKF